jgi:hypothetical protein
LAIHKVEVEPEAHLVTLAVAVISTIPAAAVAATGGLADRVVTQLRPPATMTIPQQQALVSQLVGKAVQPFPPTSIA